MIKGFSTGSLAFGDFAKAIEMLSHTSSNAIELSALREHELPELLDCIDQLNLEQFDYISMHAPSRIENTPETKVLSMLETLIERIKDLTGKTSPVVVHPDIIKNYKNWRTLSSQLLIENMDKRKKTGQNVESLIKIFDELPEAQLCFDIGHARQVDPTMTEGINIVLELSSKIKELHVSDVNSASKHERLNFSSFLAFKKVVPHLPDDAPIIMESLMVNDPPNLIEQEMKLATYVLHKDPYNAKDQELVQFHKDVYGEPADV